MVISTLCSTFVSCIVTLISPSGTSATSTRTPSTFITSTFITSTSRGFSNSSSIISSTGSSNLSSSSIPVVSSSVSSSQQSFPTPPINDIACIGNMVPACCDGSAIADSDVLTGCERYSVWNPICLPRGQVYCCDSLHPAVPCEDGDCGLFGFDCQDYYGDNCDPADAGCGNKHRPYPMISSASSTSSSVSASGTSAGVSSDLSSVSSSSTASVSSFANSTTAFSSSTSESASSSSSSIPPDSRQGRKGKGPLVDA